MTNLPSPAPRTAWHDGVSDIGWGILLGVAVSVILIPAVLRSAHLALRVPPVVAVPAAMTTTFVPVPTTATAVFARVARFADFAGDKPSPDARHVADWVADSRDSANADFVIVDKKYAKVYVFDGNARLRGSTPVLLGSARGDDTVPGIGSRPIALVRPEERTTPAGRFVAERGRNTLGEDVVWVDYNAAVSMHRVRATNPQERRLERLATPTIADNRISYGCINVPKAFYEATIYPVFAARRAVVYVLPDVKPVQQVFGSYDVATIHAGASTR